MIDSKQFKYTKHCVYVWCNSLLLLSLVSASHWLHCMTLSFRVAWPLATSSRARGKALCSTVFTLSANEATVSLGYTGTDSCTTMAPASTSSYSTETRSRYSLKGVKYPIYFMSTYLNNWVINQNYQNFKFFLQVLKIKAFKLIKFLHFMMVHVDNLPHKM